MRDMPEYKLVVLALKTGLIEATVKKESEEKSLALEWIASESRAPFSFRWCCDILELRAELVREAVGTGRLYRSLRTNRVYPGQEAA